jgi:hypothetical protein
MFNRPASESIVRESFATEHGGDKKGVKEQT